MARLRDEGKEVWLELGLQSAFDHTLDIVNRGHGFSEYRDAVQRARARGIPVCTHLILGLPGETAMHGLISLRRVLELGVDGLKLHPLHVVKNSALARDWREGRYRPMPFADYVMLAAELIRHTPRDVAMSSREVVADVAGGLRCRTDGREEVRMHGRFARYEVTELLSRAPTLEELFLAQYSGDNGGSA